jgi:hypothetical protein
MSSWMITGILSLTGAALYSSVGSPSQRAVHSGDRALNGGYYIIAGEPIIQREIGYGVQIAYDGRQVLLITDRQGNRHSVPAKAPAMIWLSFQGRVLLHNFGGGSGQVYHLRLFRINPWQELATANLENRVSKLAKRHGCRIGADEVSVLVLGWSDSKSLRLRTENWSRRVKCDVITRYWTLPVESLTH